jgi:tubulin delta
MPVVTIQVGQCGNQLGSALFSLLADAQDKASQSSSSFFRHGLNGQMHARCILVDTEPKVIQSALSHSTFYDKRRAFVGQSGRGNNWAFGYNQLISSSSDDPQRRQKTSASPSWNSNVMIDDPNQEEFKILEKVMEGVRTECEACDFAPDFLLVHSLGGGSGSGLGSRLLELIRSEHPLNYIATCSVAPRAAGDSPMQACNTVIALSFLQHYADAIMVFNNQEMLDAAGKGKGEEGANLSDANDLIARHLQGALWPVTSPTHPDSSIDPSSLPSSSRIRDIVSNVACDTCCKIIECRTAYAPSSSSTSAVPLWSLKEASKALNRLWPRFDSLDESLPIHTSASLITARGLEDLFCSSARKGRTEGDDANLVRTAFVGSGKRPFVGSPRDAIAVRWDRETRGSSISEVACRSSVIGLVRHSVERATAAWTAGAYVHWYERYGCSKEAIREAIEVMDAVVDCYTLAHMHGAS